MVIAHVRKFYSAFLKKGGSIRNLAYGKFIKERTVACQRGRRDLCLFEGICILLPFCTEHGFPREKSIELNASCCGRPHCGHSSVLPFFSIPALFLLQA